MSPTGSENSRVVGRDDQVTRPAQHETGGDAFALHGGNRGFDQIAPPPGVVQIAALLPIEVGLDGEGSIDPLRTQRGIATPLHVVPGREVFPLAAQDHDSDLRVAVRQAPRIIELLEHLWILCIGGLRAIDGDHGDAAVDFVTNEFGFHGILPGAIRLCLQHRKT